MTPARKNPQEERSPTLQEEVYEELRRSLMTGVFVPGESLSLRRLATQLGISIMPIREALNRLIAERAFEVTETRQMTVPNMTESRLAEIAYWRVQLESQATRAACRNMTSELLTKLGELNETLHEAAAQDRRDLLLPRNYEFHFAIYRQSQSQVMLPMIESLWLQAGPFTFYSVPSPRALWDGRHHAALIDALAAGDEDGAAMAIADDIRTTTDYLLQCAQFTPPQLTRLVRRTGPGKADRR